MWRRRKVRQRGGVACTMHNEPVAHTHALTPTRVGQHLTRKTASSAFFGLPLNPSCQPICSGGLRCVTLTSITTRPSPRVLTHPPPLMCALCSTPLSVACLPGACCLLRQDEGWDCTERAHANATLPALATQVLWLRPAVLGTSTLDPSGASASTSSSSSPRPRAAGHTRRRPRLLPPHRRSTRTRGDASASASSVHHHGVRRRWVGSGVGRGGEGSGERGGDGRGGSKGGGGAGGGAGGGTSGMYVVGVRGGEEVWRCGRVGV